MTGATSEPTVASHTAETKTHIVHLGFAVLVALVDILQRVIQAKLPPPFRAQTGGALKSLPILVETDKTERHTHL